MKFLAENVHDLRHTFSAVYGQTVKIKGRPISTVSVKFHKADDTATQTATASLETPMANSVDKEEDAPHKPEEAMDISLAK